MLSCGVFSDASSSGGGGGSGRVFFNGDLAGVVLVGVVSDLGAWRLLLLGGRSDVLLEGVGLGLGLGGGLVRDGVDTLSRDVAADDGALGGTLRADCMYRR